MVQRCQRVYDLILKSEEPELYNHLIVTSQMSPELQLMRWFRCALSREFTPDVTLECWDFILGGVYTTTISKCQD